jgi:predicted transcriptional regulator
MFSISTLLTRNLHDVFGENDPSRRRAAIDKVHRLFVVDSSGVLVGVISALDVLRDLCRDKTVEE